MSENRRKRRVYQGTGKGMLEKAKKESPERESTSSETTWKACKSCSGNHNGPAKRSEAAAYGKRTAAGFSQRNRKEVKAREAYVLIERMASKYPVSCMCQFFEVSRSGYSRYLKRKKQPNRESVLSSFAVCPPAPSSQAHSFSIDYSFRQCCSFPHPAMDNRTAVGVNNPLHFVQYRLADICFLL